MENIGYTSNQEVARRNQEVARRTSERRTSFGRQQTASKLKAAET